MVQKGFIKRIADRGYEDFVSMKKYIRHIYDGSKTYECLLHHSQTTPTSATPVEFEETGGLTIADAAKTAKTLVMAASADNNAYDTQTITIHYFTNAGVAKTAVGTFNAANSTTEVAFSPAVADFYCWDLQNYTYQTCIVSSVAAAAGEYFYIGTTGLTAELRYATIAPAGTYALSATMFGVGNCFVLEESNTAGDVGKVVTNKYWTPWGQLRTCTGTLAANTTTIVRMATTNSSTTEYCMDFYRRFELETTGLVGKYVAIGIDADKVVGTAAIDIFYGVIEEGNYESIHSRQFVPRAADGKKFLGDIHITQQTSKDYPAIIYIIFQTKGCVAAEQLQWSVNAGSDITIDGALELEPLSEVYCKVADDGTHPVEIDVSIRNLYVIL